MKIELNTREHIKPWARLRAELWPDTSIENHNDDIVKTFFVGDNQAVAFIALSDLDEVIGFAEASLRKEYVNGCETSPVVFLEGIYVQPAHRRKGAARLLCAEVARWGKLAGGREFASDVLLENDDSQVIHTALGFEESERVVFFRKAL